MLHMCGPSWFLLAVFKRLSCPFSGCPQHTQGRRKGIGTRSGLIQHITTMHKNHIHLADMQLCQLANVHICQQCDCEVFPNEEKLLEHKRAVHPNSRVASNINICRRYLQGPQSLNYNLQPHLAKRPWVYP